MRFGMQPEFFQEFNVGRFLPANQKWQTRE